MNGQGLQFAPQMFWEYQAICHGNAIASQECYHSDDALPGTGQRQQSGWPFLRLFSQHMGATWCLALVQLWGGGHL